MGREVRMVPANWKHPKNRSGSHVPLHDGFTESRTRWVEGKAKGQPSFIGYGVFYVAPKVSP